MENQEGCFAMCIDTRQPCVLSIVPQCHTRRQSLTIDESFDPDSPFKRKYNVVIVL
jgi:hypothetical protein